MIKIAMFDTKAYDQEFFTAANKKYGCEIHYFADRLSRETAPLVAGYDVVCLFVNDTCDAEVAKILVDSGVKLIALRCAGYNNVDMPSLCGKIPVVRVPAYSPYAVAEHAVAMIMALNRKTGRAANRTKEANFTLNGLLGFDLHGKTAGIIGTGKIGRALIAILRGFGMRVLAQDPYPDMTAAAQLGYEYVDLDTLYKNSDIISLHCPLTPENNYLINSESIAKMKDGVMLINTGRGKLIKTVDLIAALKSKKIGYAGLDVYEEEGGCFFNDLSDTIISDDILSRLLTFPNVLVTSHQAFFTKEALTAIADVTMENIRLYFEEGKLPNDICANCTGGGCGKK